MLSRVAYFVSVLLMCYASFFFYPRYKQHATEATIAWDVSGYYWYLPSIFIYKDLEHQAFKDSILKKYTPTGTNFQQGMQLDNGNYVMKYSSGMAVMFLPFFTIAHILAGPLGYPKDGFSLPYQLAIQLGGFLISILGLWYLRKLLLNFYSDKVVAITLALLIFGSNYLNYSAIDCGMSHCWLFTIYVFILLNTHYFYQSFKVKYAIRIGLLVGIATLTRPTDIISGLIPLLWGMESISFTAIKERITLVIKQFKGLLLAGICAALVISIQLIYWKHVSGHWLVYSYGDQSFSWKHPHALLYSFNYRCGWLVYAPMLMLAIAGFIPFLKNGKNKVAIIVFCLLNYYIVSAWDIWWYGGRAMVQSYPVFMFPLATLVNVALDRKILLWIITPIAILFIYFNVWITWQYHRGNLYDSDSMTKRYFWRVLGRWSAPGNTIVLRDDAELFEGVPRDLHLLYQNDLKNDTGAFHTSIVNKGTDLLLTKDKQFSSIYHFAFNGDHAKWLRIQATFHCKVKEWETWRMAEFVVKLIDSSKPGNKAVKANMIRVYRVLNDGDNKDISLDMKLPHVHYDSVNIQFWNGDGDKELGISNLQAWSFNE